MMSREILFRGKRIDNGEWVEGALFDGSMYCYIVQHITRRELNPESECKGTGFLVDRNTVCQYTGLTDKNGKKVFDGDICEFSVFDYNGHDTQYKGVVVYTGSRYMLWKSKESEYYGSDGGFDLDWVMWQDDEFEIVGNIFDNPELI